jgi:hypothetical protein
MGDYRFKVRLSSMQLRGTGVKEVFCQHLTEPFHFSSLLLHRPGPPSEILSLLSSLLGKILLFQDPI